MSKQQNDLFTQQNVQSSLSKDIEEAKKILTSVQAKDINAVYKIANLPSRILQKLNGKTSINAEKILTEQLSALKKSYGKIKEKFDSIDSKPQKLDKLSIELATEKEELQQVETCLNLIHAINDISVSIKQILDFSGISPRLIAKLTIEPLETTISKVLKQLEELFPFNDPVSESDSGYASSTTTISKVVEPLENLSPTFKAPVSKSDSSYASSTTTISKVVEPLENLLPTFNDPVSESDSDYASSTTTISKVVEPLENLLPTFKAPVSESDSDYTFSDDDFSSSESDFDYTSSDDDSSSTQHTVQVLRNILLTNNPQHPLLLKIKEAADKFTQELDNVEHHINNNDDVSVAGGDVEHNDTL